MILYKLTIKFFADSDAFSPAAFVPVFHRWIQGKSFPDHLLIDVADYAHVPDGPGTLLITSQANIHMDRMDQRLGLTYFRKLPIEGANAFPETLKSIFGYALTAAIQMQGEESLGGRLKFDTREIAIGFADRLVAPNTPETIAEYYPQVAAFMGKLFPDEKVAVEPSSKTPKELIDLRVKTSGASTLSDLALRLASLPTNSA